MPIIQLDYVGLIVQNPSSSPEKTGSNMMTIPDISWLLCPFFISQDPATCIHATFAAGSLGRKSGTFHPELPATVAKSKIRFFFSCEISPFSSFWGTHAISKKDGMIWNGKPFLLKKNIHFYISIIFYLYLLNSRWLHESTWQMKASTQIRRSSRSFSFRILLVSAFNTPPPKKISIHIEVS